MTHTRITHYVQVRFDNTINDVGYGWDPREGIFSTYYPGLYVFSWTGVSPSNSQFRLTLMKNGREIAHAWSEEHGYQVHTYKNVR